VSPVSATARVKIAAKQEAALLRVIQLNEKDIKHRTKRLQDTRPMPVFGEFLQYSNLVCRPRTFCRSLAFVRRFINSGAVNGAR